jgi:hypothetical protein
MLIGDAVHAAASTPAAGYVLAESLSFMEPLWKAHLASTLGPTAIPVVPACALSAPVVVGLTYALAQVGRDYTPMRLLATLAARPSVAFAAESGPAHTSVSATASLTSVSASVGTAVLSASEGAAHTAEAASQKAALERTIELVTSFTDFLVHSEACSPSLAARNIAGAALSLLAVGVDDAAVRTAQVAVKAAQLNASADASREKHGIALPWDLK